MEIIGKQKLKQFFDTAVKNKTYSHFYILAGSDGIGKKTLVKYVAQALHCRETAAPCGVCSACILHKVGNHPDYVRVDSGDDKKVFSVDAVRRVAADAFIKPLISDIKVYVITADKPLGVEGQNAFLKLLEEPPNYAVIFILVKSADSLLQTVLSRGVLCSVPPCSQSETVYYINKYHPEASSRAELIAGFSGGILGKAKSLSVGDGYFELRDGLYTALSAACTGDVSWILDISNYFLKNKEHISTLLELLLSWLRDTLYLKTTGGENVINFDYKPELLKFGDVLTIDKVMETAIRTMDMAEKFKTGNNLELWTINLFGSIPL